VRGLAWLGGQGTRAVAALVFIGIAVPLLGKTLKPFCELVAITSRIGRTTCDCKCCTFYGT
jgi:hypothetical protein